MSDARSYKVAPAWIALWAGIGVAAVWFAYSSVVYVSTRDPQAGATLYNRQVWYYAHMVFAAPIIVIAPFQFLPAMRVQRPRLHRLLGQAFLTLSILAACLAIWLGATIEIQGSRIPLALFGMVWAAFSVAAWVCAAKRDFVNHRKFVIRSFAIGLAFVWVRLLGEMEDQLLSFIDSKEVRETTQEYLSFILPLLIVEAWLTWIPACKSALRR